MVSFYVILPNFTISLLEVKATCLKYISGRPTFEPVDYL
jgi:hypothetical protein